MRIPLLRSSLGAPAASCLRMPSRISTTSPLTLRSSSAGDSSKCWSSEKSISASSSARAASSALLLRVGGQGVAQALDLREIEAVVEEGAARELARLSVADDGRGTSAPWNGGEDGLDGGLAAVHMEFEDVIACDGPGAGKVEDQGAGIENVARWWRAGIVEGAHRGLAG
ncbi:hypothetical protein VDGD_21681 [Verticillium dahliae]|nr:hypothetical protein VDGD_21681 [Verticillium dahliae]